MSGKNFGPVKPIFSRPPHQLSAEQVADELQTNVETGLSQVKSEQYLHKYGDNVLDGSEGVPIWKVFFKQVSNAM